MRSQTQLQHATSSLKELFQRQNRQLDERDIGSLLTAGTFRHSGPNLIGSWPISRAFLEALLGA